MFPAGSAAILPGDMYVQHESPATVLMISPATAATTLKPERGADMPLAAVTVNVRPPTDASPSTTIQSGMRVAVPPGRIVAVTPVPLNATEVAPVKLDPDSIAAACVPCIVVSTVSNGEPSIFEPTNGGSGAGFAFTVKLASALEIPLGV